MNSKIIAILVVLFVAIGNTGIANDKPTDQESSIIIAVLKQSYSGGGYTVVTPETEITHLNLKDSKEIDVGKKYIKKYLQEFGEDVPKLVDRLFERNKSTFRLSIQSSPKDGYVVDYNRKYNKYFEKNGGGWEKWHKENPKAHGSTTVSLPVYDEKHKFVLIYKGSQTDWLAGVGYILLYKYEKGELKELKKVMVWIS